MGLFVGMTTLDLIYLAPQLPRSDEKIVAIDSSTAAGGPATNGISIPGQSGETAQRDRAAFEYDDDSG
jgi:hypothetical protein